MAIAFTEKGEALSMLMEAEDLTVHAAAWR